MLLTKTAKKIVETVRYITCEGCCDCCKDTKKKALTKSDIQHSFRDSVSHFDSTSVTYETSATTAKSFRERSESEKSEKSDNVSRTDSVSSSSNVSFDYRKSTSTPIIDMKPIEFWAANKETVQPRSGGRRRLPSETEITIGNFQKDLYETEKLIGESCLTDEDKLSKYQLGQVHFGLQYEVSSNVLIVKIIEAKELPLPYSFDDNKQDLAHSNPYCKISLIPDQKNSHQTSVQRKTQDPAWNEYFMFEIPFVEANERTLEILIKDFDKYSRHCIIGEVHFPLEGINLVKGVHVWKPLMPSIQDNHDLGEMLLSLNYLPSAGRLNIDIIKAKQLLQTDLVGGSDPYVKITLVHFEKPIKTKKTTCKKNTLDPVFNESVSFNITPQQLETSSIVLTAWDYNTKSKDDYIGRIVIGKYATGPHEFNHWTRMLQSQRSAVAQWHSLRTREQCDQVSPASIGVP